MEGLLAKVKQNLILDHDVDDELLELFIAAAITYAESYQHIPAGTYSEKAMPATTEQAVIMLSSHVYESRDGSTGGFFADNPQNKGRAPCGALLGCPARKTVFAARLRGQPRCNARNTPPLCKNGLGLCRKRT